MLGVVVIGLLAVSAALGIILRSTVTAVLAGFLFGASSLMPLQCVANSETEVERCSSILRISVPIEPDVGILVALAVGIAAGLGAGALAARS